MYCATPCDRCKDEIATTWFLGKPLCLQCRKDRKILNFSTLYGMNIKDFTKKKSFICPKSDEENINKRSKHVI